MNIMANKIKDSMFIFWNTILLSVIFVLSYKQLPLYSSNQNTYFLHGLASAGKGYLKYDWLAQTVDPFPVFSTLVKIVFYSSEECAFYLIYYIILFIYFRSVLGVVCYVFDIYNKTITCTMFTLLLIFLYSGFLYDLCLIIPGMWRMADIISPDGIFVSGVAGQYVLGPIFQPSVFGVFLIASIAAFIRKNEYAAVVFLGVAASFHSTYILSSGALTCTYITIIYAKDNHYRKALALGVLSIALVGPILTYSYLNFRPTTNVIFHNAQNILVNERIPHHAKVGIWLSKFTLIQISVVMFGIYLTRKTRLFLVLLIPFLISLILTVIQMVTESNTLALLFPWRISIFLVPISSSIVLARIIIFFREKLVGIKSNEVIFIKYSMVVAVFILGYIGAHRAVSLFNKSIERGDPLTKFITANIAPSDVFMIPTDMESFRLATGAPILVDFKSHPYKDIEVVEWQHRLELANHFYESTEISGCYLLGSIINKYKVNHIIFKAGAVNVWCDMYKEIYSDNDFKIYRLKSY